MLISDRFRWVSCQLDALEGCLERKTLLKAFQSLPQTLDETYERILANIPSAHIHHTKRILQFLIYSERPLRLEEAVDAIAVDVGRDVARGRRFDPKDRLPVPEEITRYCSSLVVLVSKQYKNSRQETRITSEIQLAHFSVKDYLTSDRRTPDYLHEWVARTSIAEVCLSYLLVPDVDEYEYFEMFRYEESLAEFFEDEYPFARYAAAQWRPNAVRGGDNVRRLVKELCLDDKQFSLASNLCPLEYADMNFQWMAPPIYYASLYGVLWWVQMLIDEGPKQVARINWYCGDYETALHAAVIEGHTEIMHLLLKEGANVNKEVACDTVLIAAIKKGDEHAVQILLDKGADVNARTRDYDGPIDAAVRMNSTRMVQRLLDNGAGIGTHNTDYNTALQTAQERGCTEIVQLLLRRQTSRFQWKRKDRVVRTRH